MSSSPHPRHIEEISFVILLAVSLFQVHTTAIQTRKKLREFAKADYDCSCN